MKTSNTTSRTTDNTSPFRFNREERRLLAANAAELEFNPDANLLPVAHLFHGIRDMRWLIVALDLAEPNIAYCVADWGGGDVETGWWDLHDIANIPTIANFPTEVESFWGPGARVHDYLRDAERTGCLNKSLSVPSVVAEQDRARAEAESAFAMTPNAAAAFAELLAMGAPVVDHDGECDTEFKLCAELEDDDSQLFADYERTEIKTRDGIRADVSALLKRHRLVGEWINAGQYAIYDNNRC